MNEEMEQLIVNLTTPENYKKNIKPYRQSVAKGDKSVMELIATTVSYVIEDKDKQKPMTQLNSVRLIKETLDQKNLQMKELVENNVLPVMTLIGEFQKHNTSDDRGKTYFSENPPTNLQVLGNSFFRLILECLLVWGAWFPNSEFSQNYEYLEAQGVKFPETLNYFKDINVQQLKEQKLQQQNKNENQNENNSGATPNEIQLQKYNIDDNKSTISQQSQSTSFKQLVQENVDQHKIKLITSANFRKLSPKSNSSYMTLNSSYSKKSLNNTNQIYFSSSNSNFYGGGSQNSLSVPKTPNQANKSNYSNFLPDNINSPNGAQSDRNYVENQEIKKLHNKIDILEQERDNWKEKYEQDHANLLQIQKEFEKLKQEHSQLQHENLQLQQQQASQF